LSTFAVAEQLYDAILTWQSTRFIDVTQISLAFFQQVYPKASIGRYEDKPGGEFGEIIRAVKTFADGFVKVAAKATPSDGSLSEQFDKNKGTPRGIRDLTWSYASALTAGDRFAGVKPASWGAKGLIVPSKCASDPNPGLILPMESIYIAGSVDLLKLWSPDNALPLRQDK
jgi:glucoamylase